jgi:hypothetical protein
MNKTLITLIALSASVMADEAGPIAARMHTADSGKQSSSQQNMVRQDSGMMNTSARPVIQANDWFLFGTALWWRADEGGTDWAIREEATLVGHNLDIKEHNRKLEFGWDWGFRAGIGYNMVHDQWDTMLYYTWFHTKKAGDVGSVGTAFDQVYAQNIPNLNDASYSHGEISWSIHYSTIDWDLGRPYYVSKCLTFRPHVGLKGAWIEQHVHGSFDQVVGAPRTGTTGGTDTFKKKNNFWGVGPTIGLNTNWAFGSLGKHGFGMFGDVCGAMMYGHFDISDRTSTTNASSNTTTQFGSAASTAEVHFTNANRDLMSSMMQFAIGLSWDTNFNNDRCHFCLRLGYELQQWFRQNQMITVHDTDDTNNAFPTPGQWDGFTRASEDLRFQGGTLTLRFDF